MKVRRGALAAFLVVACGTVLGAQGMWYQAYLAGVRALGEGKLAVAEQQLKAALLKRPMAGRNVPATSSVTLPYYIPKYYLGLVYTRQKRYAEALRNFDDVVRSNVVSADDRQLWEDLRRNQDMARANDEEGLKARVVRIEAVWPSGDRRVGAGIIVGGDGQTLDIVTALHVLTEDRNAIKQPRSISVTLRGSDPLKPDEAMWLNKNDQNLDVAAIRLTLPADRTFTRGRWEFRDAEASPSEPVITVGHFPADWSITRTNFVMNDPRDQEFALFAISAAGLDEGASGGAVIDNRGNLAGMMIRVSPDRVRVVHASQIKRLSTLWGLSVDPPLVSSTNDRTR
jgi:hypothetical protein